MTEIKTLTEFQEMHSKKSGISGLGNATMSLPR
jgi:hypothetical protein